MEKIKAAEFVNNVAEATGLSKSKTGEVIDTVFAEIKKQMLEGKAVGITGFGTFEVKTRAERIGHNPRTKEEMTIPAKKVPAFKPYGSFKDEFNA